VEGGIKLEEMGGGGEREERKKGVYPTSLTLTQHSGSKQGEAAVT
jgi:hypothetical protein